MNRRLLPINALLVLFACFISFKTFSMEQQNSTHTEFQKNSLAIIKAAVERDGDTMKKILDSTPVAERTFYIDFPQYDFGYDGKGAGYNSWYAQWHKVYNNYCSLVDVGKTNGMVNDAWRIPGNSELAHLVFGDLEDKNLHYAFKFKDSKGQLHTYAIDKPIIKSDENGGDPINIKLTPLMIDTYAGDIKSMEQDLSKFVNQQEVIYSLFVAIEQECFDCLKLLLSKKDLISSWSKEKDCGLYRTLLAEVEKRKNINMFKLLIKENPLDCLNIPLRYPAKEISELRTVLDHCSRESSPSSENSDFFKQCVEICEQYGAKTLNQLVREGYVIPQKPEKPWAKYEKGYIND